MIAAANDVGSLDGSKVKGYSGEAGKDGGAGADLTVGADAGIGAGAGATPCDAAALAATGALATRSFTIRTAESTDDLLPLTYTTRDSFAPIDS